MAWWKDNRPELNFPDLERKLGWATFYKDDLRETQARSSKLRFPIKPLQITQVKLDCLGTADKVTPVC